MYIKQVLISGFRSFRSQTEIESFSEKHNVIVGRNGSGKSNFFDAIQFVLLAPKFATLRQEDRQNLLHEGAGSNVMAAYVEIVFDNSDGRFSVESDEVVLRRTVGHKKDEFFLNRKRIQKSEAQSLLESAGFSRTNPYYIVQQGRVASLCLMRDEDRLGLIKQVAGTTVYEERREESLKIMGETKSKREKVDEVLSFIEERLNELDAEKRELAEYESLDRKRRALEYALLEREYQRSTNELNENEEERESIRNEQQTLHTKLRDLQDVELLCEEEVNNLKVAIDRLSLRKDKKNEETQSITSKIADVESQIQEYKQNLELKENLKKERLAQLNDIEEQIKETNQKIESLLPAYEEKNEELENLIDKFTKSKQRIDALYSKQGRNKQFSTKEERDEFLSQQIQEISEQLQRKEAIHNQQLEELKKTETQLETLKTELMKEENENKKRSARQETLATQVKDYIATRNELQERRKKLWRDLEKVQENISDSRQELDKAKQQLNRTLPRAISQGLEFIEKYVSDNNIQGYYGPVIDNIKLKSDAFRVPVEVAAGNALFHVIVDTDKTAALFIKELEKHGSGRITFLPLNQLRSKKFTYPTSPDIRPLIQVAFEYDQEIDVAIKLIFGQKLIARDLDTASIFSKDFQMDAITMEGDIVNHRGAFEGGYHDDRLSKILAVFKIREASDNLSKYLEDEEKMKKDSADIDVEITNVLRNLQKLEAEGELVRLQYEQQTKEIFTRSKQLTTSSNNLKEGFSKLKTGELEIISMKEQIKEYENEMKSPLIDKLSRNERNELMVLEKEVHDENSQLEALKSEVSSLKNEINILEVELNSNLLRQKEELELKLKLESDSLNEASTSEIESKCNNLMLEINLLRDNLKSCEEDLKSISSQWSEKSKEYSNKEKFYEKTKEKAKKMSNQLDETTQKLDTLLNKKSILIETVHTRQRLIRELGSLPKKELDESRKLEDKTILKRLKEVSESLKEYSVINRKALDQYLSFNEQRESLLQRKQEMDKDTESITRLIQSLDEQKDDAIIKTFNSISEHFSDVFAELVPGGSGKLVLKKAESASESGQTSLSDLLGVKVQVQFTGSGQQYNMQQLSGGQKSLVALALIFAIQRYDPAPFYLFDEIDQALDANYRTSVARLIEKQARGIVLNQGTDNEVTLPPVQFITTTFRPELVSVADKCFGIALSNKVSNLHPLSKQHAQDFVTNLMQEEEKVGVPSSMKYNNISENINEIEEEGHISEHPEDDEEEEEEEEQPVRTTRRSSAKGKRKLSDIKSLDINDE